MSEEQQAEMAEETAEAKRYGFQCLSEWDGNHDGFEELVRDALNDPDSMETDETRMSTINEGTGKHTIIMTFRARNAFGGMVRHTATGWVDPETCEAELLGID